MGPLNHANNKETESFGGNGFRQKCMEKSLLSKVAATSRRRWISGLAFRVYSQKQIRNLNSTFFMEPRHPAEFFGKMRKFSRSSAGYLAMLAFLIQTHITCLTAYVHSYVHSH